MSGDLLDKFRGGDGRANLGPCVSRTEVPPLMLDFKKLTGNRASLHSNFLVALEFDPSEGIRLTFSTHEVVISGRNLEPIYEALVEHAVSALRETNQRQENIADGLPAITKISIQRID